MGSVGRCQGVVFGTLSLIVGVAALLFTIRVAMAGDAANCRTYASASPITPYAIGHPPLDPGAWEPTDPTDPALGVRCEKLACQTTCYSGTVGGPFHVDSSIPYPFLYCDCGGSELEDQYNCRIIAQFTSQGNFVRYSRMGTCEDEEACSLSVSNQVFRYTHQGVIITADVECNCQ